MSEPDFVCKTHAEWLCVMFFAVITPKRAAYRDDSRYKIFGRVFFRVHLSHSLVTLIKSCRVLIYLVLSELCIVVSACSLSFSDIL